MWTTLVQSRYTTAQWKITRESIMKWSTTCWGTFGSNMLTLSIRSSHLSTDSKIYHSITFYTICVPSTPHRYQSGRVRPYSLQLGRRIKWKLWERLDRPAMTSSTHQDGLTHVDVSYRAGLSPPLYDLDTLGEPSPGQPPLKGAKKSDWPESSGFTPTLCNNSSMRSNPACKYWRPQHNWLHLHQSMQPPSVIKPPPQTPSTPDTGQDPTSESHLE